MAIQEVIAYFMKWVTIENYVKSRKYMIYAGGKIDL